MSVLFSFLISQAHYLDKVVKGTVYLLFVGTSLYNRVLAFALGMDIDCFHAYFYKL